MQTNNLKIFEWLFAGKFHWITFQNKESHALPFMQDKTTDKALLLLY